MLKDIPVYMDWKKAVKNNGENKQGVIKEYEKEKYERKE